MTGILATPPTATSNRLQAGVPRACLLACAVAWACQGTVWGQLPTTELTTVYPPGAKQGATVEVTVGGGNQEDVNQLQFSHPGIQAAQKVNPAGEFQAQPQPVPGTFTVTVAADVPPGIYETRAVGRFGLSNPRAFVIGRFDELVDDGSNRQFEQARELPVPSVVNGRVDASSGDFYRIALKQGQRVLIDCLARQIDSRLDATLILLDDAGKELARSRDYQAGDPLIDFVAPADGNYIVKLHDFVYGGGAEHFYRLRVHQQPHVDAIFPPSALPGQPAQLTVYGRDLPDGKPAEQLTVNGQPLEMQQVTVNVPEQNERQIPALVPPRAAVLDGIAWQLDGSNPVDLYLAQAPVVTESEPNDEAGKAQQVSVPCEVAGRFYPEQDVDWVQFDAKAGEVFWIDLLAHRLGRLSDPLLVVQRVERNEKGEESVKDVTQADDPADRNNRIGSNFDTSTDDPQYRLQVPADGTYRVMVVDNLGGTRSDPRFVYRLVIRHEQPDFRLAAYPEAIKLANNNEMPMWSPVLRRGGTTLLKVVAERRDGFNEPIELQVEGLPEKVHAAPATIGAGSTSAWLVFRADEDAAAWSGSIRIRGSAKIGGELTQRWARPGTLVWGTGNRTTQPPEYRMARELTLSVIDSETAPALVQTGAPQVWETSLGGKLTVPIQVVRRNGFAEDLKLVAEGLPNELKPKEITVAKDKSEAELAIEATNAKAPPGVYTFFLRGDAKFKYSRNPDAVTRAEADLKHVTEVLAQTAEQAKSATATSQSAAKAAQETAAAKTQAEQARAQAATALKQAEEAAKQAAQQVAAAQTAAEKAPDNEQLQQALQQATRTAEEAGSQQQAAAEQLEVADKALADAAKKAAEAEAARVAAEKALADLQEKAKRGEQAKKDAEKRLADIKKANEPKDVNFAVVSTPVQLRIVPSPLELQGPEKELMLTQGAKTELPVSVQRKYGFTDAVQLEVELPKGVSGVSVTAAPIAKDQSQVTLEVTAADGATPGRHVATLRAKAKFNNVDVQSSIQVPIQVEKKEG